MKNNYPYYVDALLSKQEQQMRNFLMYDFNISLKSMLIKYNFKEFDKWFFNSCRQTAVFGSLVLNLKYPDYGYRAYEATFNDTLFGEPVTYQHCFIIATHKEVNNRNILIDMARTTNPLVFEPINDNHFYPDVDNYKDLEMISCVEILYEDLLISPVREYMTNLTTMEFLNELLELMEKYKNSTSDKSALIEVIYDYPFVKMEQFKIENNLIGGD